MLTTKISGLENYAEMLRHLTEDKEAIKVYIEVAQEENGQERDAAMRASHCHNHHLNVELSESLSVAPPEQRLSEASPGRSTPTIVPKTLLLGHENPHK